MRHAAFSLVLALAGLFGAAPAAATMDYIYPRAATDYDGSDAYVWRVLEQALQGTADRFGSFRLAASEVTMSETRRIMSLREGSKALTVAVLPSSIDLVRQLRPVRIPIDRGLLGYRVLLIRARDQPRFAAVRSLADLRGISFGLGQGWIDGRIMSNSGLTVVEGSSFEGLFHMLAGERFDALNRSVNEASGELARRQRAVPDLAIERTLLLHYPMPNYYWFAKGEDGRLLAERVRVGLTEMVADGSLQALWEHYFSAVLAEQHLPQRHLIELPNPFLDGQDPFDDARLWFSPQQRGER